MLKKWKYVLTGAGILAAAFLYLKSGGTAGGSTGGLQFLTGSTEEQPLALVRTGQDGTDSTGSSDAEEIAAEGTDPENGFSEIQKQELKELLSEIIQAEMADGMEQYVAEAIKTNLTSMMETGQLPQAVANYQQVQSSLVNINTADAGELTRLPGIGEAKAQAILAWRAEHGAFTSVDELTEVSGISTKTVDRFRSQVTL